MNIEPIEYTELTAFKERKQIISKVNEIIDYLDDVVNNMFTGQICKIPLEWSVFNEKAFSLDNVLDGDIIVLNLNTKSTSTIGQFSTSTSFIYDKGTRSFILTSSEVNILPSENGIYEYISMTITNENKINLYYNVVRLADGTIQQSNVGANFELDGYIIRGV